MRACVHIYCGDGKGKTTAAIGLAVRAAGCGKRVLITRFLKTDHSGEVQALSGLPEVIVTPCDRNFGFFSNMTEDQKKEAGIYYSELLETTLKRSEKEEFDLLILDEIMAVCHYGLVDETRVLKFLGGRPEKLEVVLTGRNPSEKLVEMADYVSEIRKVKHPYDKGISARKGIEY
ncbi:cob(I)yrinic acid a,c-diamide adenosyltransferase [Clostridium sp. Marseille-P2415]|uniref:cob(I)yrinic acid a,c-diamide adenosyltransferase n=1 Tax=Clostridium sp. Marseille-P2415 TaxID=1805471 RepID=UPI0009885DFD|nr:cob(I)yrinic acid a,c-diamide adenosyltransferase [Clostridium sp. Marseille-P2415]